MALYFFLHTRPCFFVLGLFIGLFLNFKAPDSKNETKTKAKNGAREIARPKRTAPQCYIFGSLNQVAFWESHDHYLCLSSLGYFYIKSGEKILVFNLRNRSVFETKY